MKYEFRITEVDIRRMQRGVEGVKIAVLDQGEVEDCVWMSEEDITKNVKVFGECDAFDVGFKCYRHCADMRKEQA